MNSWEAWYLKAVHEGKLRDTPENKAQYLKGWAQVGEALGIRKDPAPPDDEFAWLYE